MGQFTHPKPINLILELFKNIKNSHSFTFLDFFAGSGTTGHAIMKLNQEDGGKRKFILATNNENNIAYDITLERMYRIIMGKGTDGNKDFKWLDKNKPFKDVKIRVLKINDKNIISLKKASDTDPIIKKALEGLELLNPNYNKTTINAYYDLAALNPLTGVANDSN